MDSKRFMLAVTLMVAVMFVTNLLLPPPPRPVGGELAGDSTNVTSPTRQATQPRPSPADSSVPSPTGPTMGVLPILIADTLAVRSPLYVYRVSTRGAALVGAELREFESLRRDLPDQPVELAPDSLPELIRYRLRLGTQEVDFGDIPFTASTTSVLELQDGSGPQTVELHSGAVNGAGITVVYTFVPDSYLIDVRIAVAGLSGQVPQLFVGLPPRLAFNEAKPEDDERALGLVVNSEKEGVYSVRLDKIEAERVDAGPLRWAAVKNKYFVTGVLMDPEAGVPFGGVISRPSGERLAADMEATLQPSSDGTFAFRLYVGPQEPQRLAALGNKFGDVNPFGWAVLRPVLRPLGHAIQWAIYAMNDSLGVGYGWVLILFGVIVRILMWPLNAKAMRSQMKNMEVQPLMKEIQTKYKDDPKRLQEEMLKLYKEKGFNPMGGCLPMLAPMPILFALFYVLQAAIAFRGESFFWLPDLSQKDPLYIIPVLMGATMFITQWLSMRNTINDNPQMKMMMYIMPPMMTFFFMNFASGLNLYYTAMNLASIPQTIQIANERAAAQKRVVVTPAASRSR